MLNAHNIAVSFGGTTLFSGLTFRFNEGERIGLIGKNGAGKSTLLKILAKEIPLEEGSLALEKEKRIGFLKQDIDFEDGRTILQEAYTAFTEIKQIERKLEHVNTQLAERQDYESEIYQALMHELDELSNRYQLIGGYNYEGKAENVLLGLGFERRDFDKLTNTFSGGWRMRIELAKLLLQENNLLLLDEPTNHLDIESIVWLENFLKTYQGVVILVSHDKLFLDNVTNRTIEISVGKLFDYPKPYSKFLELRADYKEKQLQAQKNQGKEIKRTEQLIEKFRYKASKASFAQSLIKKLDKVERIEVDEQENSVMNMRFPVSVQPGKVVIEAAKLGKRYGTKQILENVNLLMPRNSKIAFVGKNGQGKSTLAKMIVGEIEFEGELKFGHNVQIGYFAQNQAAYLNPTATVLEIMEESANKTNRTKVRDMLGAFLFKADDVEKKVQVLSGGERNRLALCKMLLNPFNVLVMDEPTNHLDIASKKVLKTALQNFEGALILVSHDRDFLQGLTNKVYHFKDKNVKEYLGDVNFFLEKQQLENLRAIEKKDVSSKNKKTKGNESHEVAKQKNKELKRLQNKSKNLESEITKLEKEITEMDASIFENQSNLNSDPNFFEKYTDLKKRLDTVVEEWSSITEKIDDCS
jgi:ATP-binding cassette subfamily F protein 3